MLWDSIKDERKGEIRRGVPLQQDNTPANIWHEAYTSNPAIDR